MNSVYWLSWRQNGDGCVYLYVGYNQMMKEEVRWLLCCLLLSLGIISVYFGIQSLISGQIEFSLFDYDIVLTTVSVFIPVFLLVTAIAFLINGFTYQYNQLSGNLAILALWLMVVIYLAVSLHLLNDRPEGVFYPPVNNEPSIWLNNELVIAQFHPILFSLFLVGVGIIIGIITRTIRLIMKRQ